VTIKWSISSGVGDQPNSANSEQQSSKEPSGDVWSQYFPHFKLAMILYSGCEYLDITEQSERMKTETSVLKGVDDLKSGASGKN